jgi:leucyl aminopeptidase
MSNNLIRTALVFAAFLCVAAFFVFGNGASARTNLHWVSVDAAELNTVASASKVADGERALNAGIARVVDGIAILQLDDQQMEDLSRGMHEYFHKCGGFVEHASEAKAIAWVERMATANRDAPTVVYSIDNQAAVNTLQAAAQETENRQTIIDLAAFPNRRYNQPSGLQSANWIKDRWLQLAGARRGISVDFFNHPSTVSPQPSVIMSIRGNSLPDEIVVLGAHQDSINLNGQTLSAPGADDDASGIACLTEIIRVMMTKNFRPARTVQFMAYAAEEVGLRGSNDIATSYRAANKNVVGSLQLDMTNYRGTQGFDIVLINDFTSAAQNQFVRDLITAYQPTLVVNSSPCGYACSDHASWFNKSYPASFPFEAPIGNDNPWIHTASDTLSQSGNNANHALKFTKLGLSFVAELAKGCISPRLACSASEPTRPLGSVRKVTSKTAANSGALLLDAMSF